MAYLSTPFNAADVPAAQSFEPLPPGEYTVQVVNSDILPTKAGTGEYIKIECDVVSGPHEGRKLFTNFNIVNPNPKAVEIGYQQLGALVNSVGITGEFSDTEALHFKPVVAVVKTKPPANGYDASNEIKGWKPVNGAAPQAAPTPAPQPAAQATPAPAANTPPWRS